MEKWVRPRGQNGRFVEGEKTVEEIIELYNRKRQQQRMWNVKRAAKRRAIKEQFPRVEGSHKARKDRPVVRKSGRYRVCLSVEEEAAKKERQRLKLREYKRQYRQKHLEVFRERERLRARSKRAKERLLKSSTLSVNLDDLDPNVRDRFFQLLNLEQNPIDNKEIVRPWE